MNTAQTSIDPIRAFLVDESRSGVVILDTSGRIDEANAAFAHLCGQPLATLIGMTLTDVLTDVQGPNASPGRHILQDARGIRHPVDLRISPLPEGGWIVAVHNLTDTEEQHEQILRFHETMEAARIAIWELDQTTLRLTVSETHRELFGLAPHAALPTTVAELRATVHPDDRDEMVLRRVALSETPGIDPVPFEAEYRIVTHTGEVRWMRTRGNLMRRSPGDLGTIRAVTREVTTELEMRFALSDSEERFRSAFETSAIGMGILSTTGETVRANAALARMVGHDVPTLSLLQWTDLVHPDDHAEVGARIRLILQGELTDARAERRFLHRDGSIVEVRITSSAVHNAVGVITGVFVQIEDITANKALEEQFRQAQKMEAIGKLAGGIAHDFNNLLTAVSATTEIVLHDLPEDHGSRPDIEQIRRAAERATTLTRRLLAFSRQQVEQYAVVDIDDAITRVAPLLQRMLSPGQELTLLLRAEGAHVLLDDAQFELAMLNLVANARDAMPTGGTITISTTTDAHALPQQVRIAVRDTGTGMDASVRARVFEPFFTTKPQGEGTGLGLPTVYGFVQRISGRVELESTPGAGSCFTLVLPTSGARPEVPAETTEPEPCMPGEACGVLVVDDEGSIRMVARRLLERGGYQVWEASGADEALRMLETHADEIDVVLSDHAMPGGTGRELLATIAARYPRIRTVLMSGFAGGGEVHEAVADRELTFIQKPFTTDVLLRAIAGPSR